MSLSSLWFLWKRPFSNYSNLIRFGSENIHGNCVLCSLRRNKLGKSLRKLVIVSDCCKPLTTDHRDHPCPRFLSNQSRSHSLSNRPFEPRKAVEKCSCFESCLRRSSKPFSCFLFLFLICNYPVAVQFSCGWFCVICMLFHNLFSSVPTGKATLKNNLGF